jgi:hypothetical protein
MTTYYIYSPQSWEFLGQLQAVDVEAAELLATQIWTKPIKVLDFRLKLNRKLAA